MTLLLARVLEDRIHFVSDTRSSPDERDDRRPSNPLAMGILKCVAISPSACVAFAGDVRAAQEAIDPRLRQPNGTRGELHRQLLGRHRAALAGFGQRDVQFLFA
jgi:hypothetical protein